MTPRPRGTCRYCGRSVALRIDGLLRGHREQPNAGSFYNRGCEGSGTLPQEQASRTILHWGVTPTSPRA
jgi:hypothetical protein